jgi:acetoin:2,6-dichlorophenolindophenol oxidoreductase subunit alpha
MNYLEVYKKIFLIRAVENKLDDLFKKGLVHGTAHFCIGQEFIPVIVSQYLTKKDAVTSTHRGHGHALAKNLDLKKFLAELLGKQAGYNYGKGGSQHVTSNEHNYYANGITGGMTPVANGMAFANKYKKNDSIVVSFIGDGAITEGYVLESLNMAVALKLPILFVCENNFYAMSTPVSKTHSSEIYKKVQGFGMESVLIDKNDYKKLDEVAKKFIEETRKGKPHFIEVRTYRHRGHSKNDKNLYRTKEEEELWLNRDVLEKLKEEMVMEGIASNYEILNSNKVCEEEVNQIAEMVISLPNSYSENLSEHLYPPKFNNRTKIVEDFN